MYIIIAIPHTLTFRVKNTQITLKKMLSSIMITASYQERFIGNNNYFNVRERSSGPLVPHIPLPQFEPPGGFPAEWWPAGSWGG